MIMIMMIMMMTNRPVRVWGVSRQGVIVGFGVAVLTIEVVPPAEVELIILR